MMEARRIILILTLFISLSIQSSPTIWPIPAIGAPSDATVSDYRVNIYSNGTMVETFTYKITQPKYRMLYRSWQADVSTTPLLSPYIRPIKVEGPTGTILYIKDRNSVVTLLGNTGSGSNYLSAINSLAEPNECGCYSPSLLPSGTYIMKYTWYIYPPLEVDSEAIHLNLMLASVHIPYDSVRITFEDASYIKMIYAHPPSFVLTKNGDKIVIEGKSGENELLEVEFLMDPALTHWDGVKTPVTHVTEKTEDVNRLYSLQNNAAKVKIIQGGVSNPISRPGNTENVWFKAVYVYDNRFPSTEEFTGEKGTIYVNNLPMTWSSFDNVWKYSAKLDDVGKLTFEVSKAEDKQYGSVNILDSVGPKSIAWEKPFFETPIGIASIGITLAIIAIGALMFFKRKN